MSNLFSVGSSYGAVSQELASRLSESGWQVVTTSSLSNRFLRPIDMLLTIGKKRKRYSVAQLDVFSGAAFRWAELSTWALRKLGKPYILTLHGGNLPAFAKKNEKRVKALLRYASAVTTPSRYLLEEMSPYVPDILLIPNPIYLSNYYFRLRQSSSPNLLYLRAIHHLYNPTMAVTSVAKLATEFPGIQLTMVGPDKGDGTLEETRLLIKQLGLDDRISLPGAIPKSHVPVAMTEADIFLNTTTADNTPISVIEAMASGLCIVSTNVGGIPYLLTHEYDALLVPSGDAEAMADAVRRILTELGLAERLSRNARDAAEKFDWSAILPQWESLLTDVIEQHYHD